MDTSLTVEFDKAADTLYLGKTKPYPKQDSEELDCEVVARLNPHTHDLSEISGDRLWSLTDLPRFTRKTRLGEVLFKCT